MRRDECGTRDYPVFFRTHYRRIEKSILGGKKGVKEKEKKEKKKKRKGKGKRKKEEEEEEERERRPKKYK